MSQLIAMFCDIDDFCKWFEPLYTRRLLQSGQRQRVRQMALGLSEIMTIIVYFHSSHYRETWLCCMNRADPVLPP